VRFSLLLLCCLCTTGCGGCVDDNRASDQPGQPPGPAALPSASVAPRSLPLPIRGIQFLMLDAGVHD
jgi:hypothetical protein